MSSVQKKHLPQTGQLIFSMIFLLRRHAKSGDYRRAERSTTIEMRFQELIKIPGILKSCLFDIGNINMLNYRIINQIKHRPLRRDYQS